jgi:aspartate/methionine/tyrosine aminotransferase
MRYRRMPIEVESPEQYGYDRIDCNLAESSLSDLRLGDLVAPDELADLVLAYGDHLGHPGLRTIVAADGEGLDPDDVLVTPGAAGALFFLHTALLEPGDHLVVVRPNYATNLETPRTLGATVSHLDLRIEDGWRIDPDALTALTTPRTKLVSITTPHNPTGSMLSAEALAAIVDHVERIGARLIVDETYRDLAFDGPTPLAASLGERAISVSSASKAYGLPGVRVGWLVTRDRALRDLVLAAKEQIVITGSAVDEELAFRALVRRDSWLPAALDRARAARATVRSWIEGERRIEWIEPQGGTVAFPRIRPDVAADVPRFHALVLDRYATAIGPGHWFEQDDRFFRVGFGWPTADRLARGLANVSAALTDAGG